MNIRKVWMVADKQSWCKQQTTRFIMDRVMAMNDETITNTIPSELDVLEDSEWAVLESYQMGTNG